MAVASLSVVMSVVQRDGMKVLSSVAMTAGLWVGATVVSWVGPSAELRAAPKNVGWGVNWAVLSDVVRVGWMAAHWVVNLSGPKAVHSAALWVLYWVAKRVDTRVNVLGRLRAALSENNSTVSTGYLTACLVVDVMVCGKGKRLAEMRLTH